MDKNHDNHTTSSSMTLENIRAIKVLGRGALGTVFLVNDKSTDQTASNPYALKVVEKSCLLSHALRRARWEISVLGRLRQQHQQGSAFLPSLQGCIDTPEFLCWATPYCPGGDLNDLRHRQPDGVFSPSVIRFYLAEIVCALEKLHEMGIVYRDLKPENILIQQSGHLTLTDFDLSRCLKRREHETDPHAPPLTRHRRSFKRPKSARVSPLGKRSQSFSSDDRSYSFVGTEEYVSPEMLRGDGHDFAVDWWAVGVLCYEMLYGATPFKGKNRKETYSKILTVQPKLPGKRTGLTDLIQRLLEKDPTLRLGYRRGGCEIKEHEFFKGLRWDMLTEVVRPPFIPSRDETDLTEELCKGGVDIKEHFVTRKAPPSPLWSTSVDELRRSSVELTVF